MEPSETDAPSANLGPSSDKNGEIDDPLVLKARKPNAAKGEGDWGDLPVHLRKVFQNGVNDRVPIRYRDWVNSYHKRLAHRSSR